MAEAIPTQHPAVVLRSHYRQLRALLAVAMIAVVGLVAAVVVLALNDDGGPSASTATQVVARDPAGSVRYDGGPEEGTRGALSAGSAASPVAGVRPDGGPEEGAAFVTGSAPTADRYDGGPEEGTRGLGH
jgi:hypothetical protein